MPIILYTLSFSLGFMSAVILTTVSKLLDKYYN